MSTHKQRGLGRGLEVLLTDIYAKSAASQPGTTSPAPIDLSTRPKTADLLREAEILKALLVDIENWADDSHPE